MKLKKKSHFTSTKAFVEVHGKRHYRSAAFHVKFEPTDQQHLTVRLMVANGVKHETIAKLIYNPKTSQPIGIDTLHKYFREDLDEGFVMADTQVTMSLFQKCIGRPSVVIEEEDLSTTAKKKVKKVTIQKGIEPDTGAIVWWDKSRAHRKETSIHQMEGQALAGPQVVIMLPPNHRDQPAIDITPTAVKLNGAQK